MRFLAVMVVILIVVFPAAAQQSQWCGYAIIGYPLLDTQLSVLAALTPGYDPYSSQPDTLFQRRWNVDHTQVIIEGCFAALPTRELVISLLDGILEESYQDIDAAMAYTLVAPELDRDVAALVVRQYILENRNAWGED